jgi:TRAP transporter TAXI family solute receptor
MPKSRTLRRTALIFMSFPSVVAIALALGVAMAFTLRFSKDFWVLTLAAADAPDVAVAEAVQQLHQGFDMTQIRVLRSENPAAASAAVDAGRAELAIVRSDVAVPKRAGTMLVVHQDAALLFASPNSKITKLGDLAKKRVGIVPGDPANTQLFDEVLNYHAISIGSVIHIPVQADQLATLLANKAVDAMFVVAPLKSSLVEQVFTALASTEKSRPTLIEIKNAEAFAARHSGLSKIDVPAGFFGGVAPQPSEDISTFAVDHQLVASLQLGEGTVDHLTKWFFLMRRALAERAPFAAYMEAAVTEKGTPFALHPGATAYYQDTEKSFMDQYGDWFYIMAMVLGGVGSAIATLISSFQARGRRAAMAVIDELMAIEVKARAANALAALKDLDAGVDRAALKALHRARESRFDEAGLETVRLAVDEARRAISTRRAELQAEPAAPGGAVTAFPARRSEPTGAV